MSDVHVDAAAALNIPDPVTFASLPKPVLRVFMLALPVDARARAACVCHSWRAFLADPSLWQVLDLTPAGGVASERVTANLVRGAVALAAGQLRVFSLYKSGSDTDFLVNLLWSAGAELQQLHTNIWLSVEKVDEVFDAAPRLQVLTAQVSGHCTRSCFLPCAINHLMARCESAHWKSDVRNNQAVALRMPLSLPLKCTP